MTAFAFIPDRDTPGKRDYSGAFKPEAVRFVRYYGGRVIEVDITAPARKQRDFILGHLRQTDLPIALDVVAFFCHGFTRRLQLGFDIPTARALADAVVGRGCRTMGLYACSTGSGAGPGGDGGFADALRDAMCAAGATRCRVLAHRTAGHVSMNPAKRFFDGMGSAVGGTGGYDVVGQTSSLWKAWKRRCQSPVDTFRFEILQKPIAEIHDILASPGAGAPTIVGSSTPKALGSG